VRTTLKGLTGSGPVLQRVSGAWFLSNFAEWAFVTALSIHEYRLHGPLALGLIGARFIPSALLGSVLLGALNHRAAPRVLQALSLARCLALAAVGLALVGDASLLILVAIVWADAVIAAPYRPIQSALLPALAGTPRELSAVAGSVPSVKALAQATGALAGSLLVTIIDPQTVVLGAVAVFLMTAVLVAGIRTEPLLLRTGPDGAGARVSAASRLGDVRAGFALVAGRARPLLILGGTRSLTRGLWTSLTVVVSLELLHLGSAGVGLLMAAAGVGAAVAVPVSLQFAGRARLAGPAALTFVMAGVPIVLVGLIAQPIPAIALIALWGLAFALADSISNALIHRVVDAPLLAPSVAALESSKLLLEGIGALVAPALLSIVGIRDALLLEAGCWRSMIARRRGPGRSRRCAIRRAFRG
jgi:predicted MFS family arabinose efflux permease